MRQRIQRVCDSFNGKTFSLPNDGQASADTYKNELTEVAKRIITVEGMISMTKRELRSYLTRIQDMQLTSGSRVSLVAFYRAFINKEKTIYC